MTFLKKMYLFILIHNKLLSVSKYHMILCKVIIIMIILDNNDMKMRRLCYPSYTHSTFTYLYIQIIAKTDEYMLLTLCNIQLQHQEINVFYTYTIVGRSQKEL